MNREYVLWNLKEAADELQRTIGELEQDPDYDYGEFVVAMSHLYHHINTAWNAQSVTKTESDECSEENFHKWRSMPTNADLLLEG